MDERVKEWMESLGFTWRKTLKVWYANEKILKPWVTSEQAAYFYQQTLEARIDEHRLILDGVTATDMQTQYQQYWSAGNNRLAALQAQKEAERRGRIAEIEHAKLVVTSHWTTSEMLSGFDERLQQLTQQEGTLEG